MKWYERAKPKGLLIGKEIDKEKAAEYLVKTREMELDDSEREKRVEAKVVVNGEVSSLEGRKRMAIAKLKYAYEKEVEKLIVYDGKKYQADSGSQQLIVNVLSAGEVPDGFYWVSADNTKVDMSYDDLRGLSKAILARGQKLFDKLQGLKKKVKAANSRSELEKIKWK